MYMLTDRLWEIETYHGAKILPLYFLELDIWSPILDVLSHGCRSFKQKEAYQDDDITRRIESSTTNRSEFNQNTLIYI